MAMKTGERWHCTNATCRCSILVEATGETEGKNPLCACGSVMRKQYAPPVFRNRCPHAKTLRRIEPCAEMFQHRAFEDFASPRNNAPTPSPSAMGHRDA